MTVAKSINVTLNFNKPVSFSGLDGPGALRKVSNLIVGGLSGTGADLTDYVINLAKAVTDDTPLNPFCPMAGVIVMSGATGSVGFKSYGAAATVVTAAGGDTATAALLAAKIDGDTTSPEYGRMKSHLYVAKITLSTLAALDESIKVLGQKFTAKDAANIDANDPYQFLCDVGVHEDALALGNKIASAPHLRNRIAAICDDATGVLYLLWLGNSTPPAYAITENTMTGAAITSQFAVGATVGFTLVNPLRTVVPITASGTGCSAPSAFFGGDVSIGPVIETVITPVTK